MISAGVGGGGLVCGGLATGTGGGPRLIRLSDAFLVGNDSTDEDWSTEGTGGKDREGTGGLLAMPSWADALPGISSSDSDPVVGDRMDSVGGGGGAARALQISIFSLDLRV